ncbi:MAG: hypothetical protein QM270_02725 [Bacillota bacterium]|nr:hypothetical protein [Bacillota bacterium]
MLSASGCFCFASREEILDAIVEGMGREQILQGGAIIANRDTPLPERLAGAVLTLNFAGCAGVEVLEQMNKPRNTLLH